MIYGEFDTQDEIREVPGNPVFGVCNFQKNTILWSI